MGRENRAQQIKGRREHDAEPRAAAGVEPRKGPCAAPCDERQLDEQEAEHRSVHAAQKGGRLKHDPHAKRVEHGMVVRKAVVPVPAGIMGRPQNLIDHVVGIDGAESGEVGQKDEDERGLQQGEADEPEPFATGKGRRPPVFQTALQKARNPVKKEQRQHGRSNQANADEQRLPSSKRRAQPDRKAVRQGEQGAERQRQGEASRRAPPPLIGFSLAMINFSLVIGPIPSFSTAGPLFPTPGGAPSPAWSTRPRQSGERTSLAICSMRRTRW